MSQIISQLPNKFYGHFATPLEYVISLIRRFLACIVSKSYLSDIYDAVPFENTTLINQNKKIEIK